MQSGIGTKSMQALQLQREALKTEHKQQGKEQKEMEKQIRFEQKQQKRKEKHRGRQFSCVKKQEKECTK